MTYKINPDLSITFSNDAGDIANYPDFNTHTQVKFKTKSEAEAYANQIMPTVILTAPVVAPQYSTMSPIALKMLFTSEERITLKNSTDDVVNDMLELLNDPRLKVIDLGHIVDMIDYLETVQIIGTGRAAEILAA